MKKIALIILISFFIPKVYSQITFENTYSFNYSTTAYNDKVGTKKICKFSTGSQYYCYSDSNTVYLYNLDHTLFKTILLPNISYTGTLTSIDYTVSNVSDKLFNDDNLVECLIRLRYNSLDSNGIYYKSVIKVINENGNELFTKDDADINEETDFSPSAIFSTINGTKMLLWNMSNNYSNNGDIASFSIYSLPGNLITLKENNPATEKKSYLSNPFPNPSNEYAAVFYQLPDSKKMGNIIIYDINGKQIHDINVNGSNEYILFNNINLSSGTYVYSLIVENKIVDSKKMIITK